VSPGRTGARRLSAEPTRPASPRLLLGTVVLAVLAAGFPVTILAVSLDDVAADLHSTSATLTWTVTGSLLGFVVMMPLAGKLGDLRGHRRVLLAGLVLLAVASGASALAWDAGSLIACRVVGGLATGTLGPSSMALVLHAFPLGDRARVLGLQTGAGAAAPVLGLIAGGPLVDSIGWRALFAVQIPAAVAVLVLAWLVVPDTPRRPGVTVDVWGAVLVALTVVSALVALDRGGRWGFGHPFVVGGFALAPVLLWTFLRHERRQEHPVIPLPYFRIRNVWAPITSAAFSNGAYMGSFILGPLLVRSRFGLSVSEAALLMLIRPAVSAAAAPIGGSLSTRIGERRAAVGGSACVVAAMALFALGAHGHSMALVVGGLALAGFGLGGATPSLVTLVANSVADRDLGAAAAANTMLVQVGVTVGIQLMTAILGDDRSAGRFTLAFSVAGLLAALGLAFATVVGASRRLGRDRADLVLELG
jgi:MFS family permease